jgi:hypothetical protein
MHPEAASASNAKATTGSFLLTGPGDSSKILITAPLRRTYSPRPNGLRLSRSPSIDKRDYTCSASRGWVDIHGTFPFDKNIPFGA